MRRILFVCTANICRSPAAELLARHRHGEQARVFRSAGFLDPGNSCPDHMIDALRGEGIDATGHRSYTLDGPSLEAADILLTMEGSHVQKATVIAPDAYPRIVPLKEAAAAMAARPEGQVEIESLLEDINRGRDALNYLDQRWDVADPYGRRPRQYRQAVNEITGLVDAVIGRLR